MAEIDSFTWIDGNTYTFEDTVARASSRIVTVNLSAAWSGSDPYTQITTISGGTANSVVDLHPDSTVINAMSDADCKALYITNNNGVFSAVAVGGAPATALTVQALVTEVTSS